MLCGVAAARIHSYRFDDAKQFVINPRLSHDCRRANFACALDAIPSWKIEQHDHRRTVARHLFAKGGQVNGFCSNELSTIPDADTGSACLCSHAIVSLPDGGMSGLIKRIGERGRVVDSYASQHDKTRSKVRMAGDALPSELRYRPRPIGAAIGSAQL